MKEHLAMADAAAASITRAGNSDDAIKLKGVYKVTCHDKDGNLKWEEEVENLVTTAGVDLMFDTLLGGSAYSVTGPFMGLIDAASFTAVANTDTMTSHGGWSEATYYSGSRPTCVWSAASGRSKALSSTLAFNINGSGGTVEGLFIVLGTGASATVSNTGGTLFCATAFTGGSRAVQNGDVVNASYTISAA